MTANQVLRDAAERLTKFGWCQGSYGRLARDIAKVPIGAPSRVGNGQDVAETCVVGAMREVGGNHGSVDEAKAKLCKSLGVENLATWNDEEGRTVGEVIDALKAAAT